MPILHAYGKALHLLSISRPHFHSYVSTISDTEFMFARTVIAEICTFVAWGRAKLERNVEHLETRMALILPILYLHGTFVAVCTDWSTRLWYLETKKTLRSIVS